jgi:hypothetical protein
MTEMYPRPTDYLQPQKSSAWLEKAKQLANQSEKKIEPFTFRPESCVKLNNIESALKLLDNMYNQMNADKLAEVLEAHGPPVPDKGNPERFLFTVKIVLAEGLVPTDNSPSSRLDSFVTLSDEAGNRKAKTRTIYETNNPRCKHSTTLSFSWLNLLCKGKSPLIFPLISHYGSWSASEIERSLVSTILLVVLICVWTRDDLGTSLLMAFGWILIHKVGY